MQSHTHSIPYSAQQYESDTSCQNHNCYIILENQKCLCDTYCTG